jgi:hypothetical protein
LGQILELVPSALLDNVIRQHESDKHCHKYKTYDQLVAMMFGQLNKCHTLREIAQGISISPKFLKDIGLEQSPAKVSDRRGADNFRYPKDTIIVDDRGYFDFGLFATRIEDQNDFVTRIKSNTVYQSIVENELPDGEDPHILNDDLIYLTGQAAIRAGIDTVKLRRVAIYKEQGNKVIEVIANNLDWSAATIWELYKRRWQIEIFFKLIKQNLQIKTFLGTTENACKSQIFIAMIVYLLLELICKNISKTYHCFGHFVTLIRVCLTQYNRLEYIASEIQITVQKAKRRYKPPDRGQH